MPPPHNPWKAESQKIGTSSSQVSALSAKRVALRSARRSLRLDDPTDALGRMGLRGELSRVEREIRELQTVRGRTRTGPLSYPGRPGRLKRRITVSDV